MKNLLLPFAVAFLVCSGVRAGDAAGHHAVHLQTQHSPVTFEVPDSWQERDEGDSHFIISPDGGDVLVEVSTMKAARDDEAATEIEAKASVDKDFKNLNLTKVPAGRQKGLDIIGFQGTGEDKDGLAKIVLIAARNPASQHPVLISIIAVSDAGEKHGQGIVGIMDTLAAPTPGKGSAAHLRMMGFPGKDKPPFRAGIPAGWKIREKDDGLIAIAPDESVSIDFTATEMKYAGTALQTMKRLAAGQYGEFVWNKGKAAAVSQLDDTMTLTIDNGKCAIKGQTLVSSFLQYVKSDRDLFLIVGIRYLTDAPDEFTNEIDGVVKSVSFR